MKSRDYKYLDPERVEERIANMPEEEDDGTPATDVLFEVLLDLLQLAVEQGLLEEEIDEVLERVVEFRAGQVRSRFRLHGGNP